MPRWFNTAGPCKPELHYMLPATVRLPQVQRLIAQQSYFVLHAPRRTGKTTAMLALARELTASGEYVAALLSLEVGAPFRNDPGAAEDAILSDWWSGINWQVPIGLRPPPWPAGGAGAGLQAALHHWATVSPRPVVLFLDEIDALRDEALIAVLRQLRAGYSRRPESFPASVALIGLRDVRDYRVAADGRSRLGTASPFNIKVESLTLRDFTPAEVAALYAQHTADTGQVFTPEAVERAFALTQGQPWLVNALARQAVEVVAPDPATPVTPEIFEAAKDLLIQRQDTHLDSLAERLREPRVRAIIEPLLAGGALPPVAQDDLRFVIDLGLCRLDPQRGLVIANPIYREVTPRVLSFVTQASVPMITPIWLLPGGGLDLDRLLDAFLAFWRRHGQPLLGSVAYHEIAPHIVLMAFLDRVANGGGSVEREYAIGSGRMDLCLRFGGTTLGVELKVWRDGEPDPLAEGLEQLDGYLAGLGDAAGWLVIFDRRSGQPPIAQRTSAAPDVTPAGRLVQVVRA